jgi:hypothetical protein
MAISRRAFNHRLILAVGGVVALGPIQACGGGNPAASQNVRPTNADGSGSWQLVPVGATKFVAQLGPDADVVSATDIALPNQPNKQSVQDALNDLANNQLVYFTNRTSFDPHFFDNSDNLRTTNYSIKDIYTLNDENGGNAIYLMPVAGDALNDNSHPIVDSKGKTTAQAGIYYAFTDSAGSAINLDPTMNKIVPSAGRRYLIGNNVKLHAQSG